MHVPRRIVGILLLICLSAVMVYGYARIQQVSERSQTLETELAAALAQVQSLSTQRCSKDLPVGIQANATYTNAHQGRNYRLHLPANFETDRRYPLLLAFDGMDGSAAHMQAYSDLDSLPAIVVYPEPTIGTHGLTAWQGAPYSSGADDISFVRELIDTVTQDYCIISDNVFTVGMSNGGAFARLAACELSDMIAASASIAGAYYKECDGGGPTLIIHSRSDQQIPYEGHVPRKLPRVDSVARNIADAQGCPQEPSKTATRPLVTEMTWYCPEVVQLIVVENSPHGWVPHIGNVPQHGTTQITDILWRFFMQSS